MGKLIVIEGLDGSGKATQSKLLAAALEQQGRPVRQISFPNYASNASWPVRMYLAGEFGPKPEDVNAYAASVLYAVDRFASYRKDWADFYRDGGILIADRYTTSNAVHQCSKLPRTAWDGYLDWLFDLEYQKIGIPKPDAVFYLEHSRAAAAYCADRLGWRRIACCAGGAMRPVEEIAAALRGAVEEIL